MDWNVDTFIPSPITEFDTFPKARSAMGIGGCSLVGNAPPPYTPSARAFGDYFCVPECSVRAEKTFSDMTFTWQMATQSNFIAQITIGRTQPYQERVLAQSQKLFLDCVSGSNHSFLGGYSIPGRLLR